MRTHILTVATFMLTVAAFAAGPDHHVTGHGPTDEAALADATLKANVMCEAEKHGTHAVITDSKVHNEGADHAVDVTFHCD